MVPEELLLNQILISLDRNSLLSTIRVNKQWHRCSVVHLWRVVYLSTRSQYDAFWEVMKSDQRLYLDAIKYLTLAKLDQQDGLEQDDIGANDDEDDDTGSPMVSVHGPSANNSDASSSQHSSQHEERPFAVDEEAFRISAEEFPISFPLWTSGEFLKLVLKSCSNLNTLHVELAIPTSVSFSIAHENLFVSLTTLHLHEKVIFDGTSPMVKFGLGFTDELGLFKNLRSLRFDHRRTILHTRSLCESLIPSFPNLTIIYINAERVYPGAFITDQFLLALSTHCTNLRVLSPNYLGNFSNAAYQKLFKSCPLLTDIKLYGMLLTKEVLDDIVTYLDVIEKVYIDFRVNVSREDIISFLEKMEGKSLKTISAPKYFTSPIRRLAGEKFRIPE